MTSTRCSQGPLEFRFNSAGALEHNRGHRECCGNYTGGSLVYSRGPLNSEGCQMNLEVTHRCKIGFYRGVIDSSRGTLTSAGCSWAFWNPDLITVRIA